MGGFFPPLCLSLCSACCFFFVFVLVFVLVSFLVSYFLSVFSLCLTHIYLLYSVSIMCFPCVCARALSLSLSFYEQQGLIVLFMTPSLRQLTNLLVTTTRLSSPKETHRWLMTCTTVKPFVLRMERSSMTFGSTMSMNPKFHPETCFGSTLDTGCGSLTLPTSTMIMMSTIPSSKPSFRQRVTATVSSTSISIKSVRSRMLTSSSLTLSKNKSHIGFKGQNRL